MTVNDSPPPRTSAPRSFLILHGWQNHRPEGHWQRWLAGELAARGHRVAYPQLPDPDTPDLAVWLDRLHTHLAAERAAELRAPAGEFVVIGHSAGALLWLHAVAARDGSAADVRADRLLLAAPPAAEVCASFPEVAAFARPAATAAQVAASARTVRLAAGDDDRYCPGGALAHYGVPLGLDTDVVPGGGHLDLVAGYGSWPSVLAWCEDPAVRLGPRRPDAPAPRTESVSGSAARGA